MLNKQWKLQMQEVNIASYSLNYFLCQGFSGTERAIFIVEYISPNISV